MNGRLRIVLLGPAHPLRGGIAHHTTSLALALSRSGHSVRFFSLRRQYPSFLFPGRTQYDSSRSPLTYPNEPVLDPLKPWTWLDLGRRIRALGPDLAVFAWWNPLFAPAYAALAALLRRAGVRTCFLCHNVEPHEPSALGRWLSRYALSRADRLVVQSRQAQAALLALGPKASVSYAPHPAYDFFLPPELPSREESRRRLELPPDAKVLLFFGHVRAYKGLDVLLRALPLALQREPGCRLLVAGEFYEDASGYLRQISELGLAGRVKILDRYIPNEEVPLLFAAADAAVLPYRSASGSGVAGAAGSFGLPVVASRVGGLPDSVHEGVTGVLVAPDDPAALAEGIERVLALSASVPKSVIRRAAADWSWEKLAAVVGER